MEIVIFNEVGSPINQPNHFECTCTPVIFEQYPVGCSSVLGSIQIFSFFPCLVRGFNIPHVLQFTTCSMITIRLRKHGHFTSFDLPISTHSFSSPRWSQVSLAAHSEFQAAAQWLRWRHGAMHCAEVNPAASDHRACSGAVGLVGVMFRYVIQWWYVVYKCL